MSTLFRLQIYERIEISPVKVYLSIIPRARMGSEPSASSAIDSEAMRAIGIIVLVKSNQLVKNAATKQLKARL